VGERELKLKSITVRYQGSVDSIDYDFDDIDIQKIHEALYAAQSAFAIKGEMGPHLVETHLIPGIAQQEFIKLIFSDHPLFKVINPFLNGVGYIDWLAANGVIFGENSVLDATALKPEDIADMIVREIVALSNWEEEPLPQPPCCENHYRAKAYRFWVEHLKSYYLGFLKDHEEEVINHWSEIHQWSQNVQKRVSTWPAFAEEIPNFEKLATFLAWLVGKTTFGHWSVHSRQQTVTDLRESSFRIQNRGLNDDKTSDIYGKTPAIYGASQLFFARFHEI
jgi:hypothetical protein